MKERKQRGSGWSIALVLFCYRFLGYRFIYYLQYPISFFYFIVASNVKEALRIYYQHLGIPFTHRRYFEHLRIFAVCLVDRFISKMEPQKYHFEYDSIEIPLKVLSKGSILVYSHFGGWASSTNSVHVDNQINMVMKESLLGSIKALEDALDKPSKINIIDLNKGILEVSINIANALMNEEVVAMMADRASNQKAEIPLDFLGEEAKFNKNPFQVAYKTNKPILVYFIVWKKIQHYKVEYIKIEMNQQLKEKEAIREAMRQYTQKYETIVKQYPNQWFNLYDFWEEK